jgi:hypothetical protein
MKYKRAHATENPTPHWRSLQKSQGKFLLYLGFEPVKWDSGPRTTAPDHDLICE